MSFPTGSAPGGLGSGESAYLLPLSVQKSWGPWTSFEHGGWLVLGGQDTRDYAVYGAALTREVSKTATIGAELFGNGPTASGSKPGRAARGRPARADGSRA